MDVWQAVATERVALADELGGLSPEQWATPSLCGGWTVRDVVGHLVSPHQPFHHLATQVLVEMVRARGSLDQAFSAIAVREARRPTADLVAALRGSAESRFHPPGFGPRAPLCDLLVHGQDIRIPLGRPLDRPVEYWRPVLDLLMTARARGIFGVVSPSGLRLVASDLDWSHGNGERVVGPASALGLSLFCRPARLDELDGPGASVVRHRVSARNDG
jgi:uncharacterized protein (TIGR03083 family)